MNKPTLKDNSQLGTPCYLWEAYCNIKTGYGQMRYNGRHVSVHRWIFSKAYPDIDITKLDICHHCDVKNCFNPAHLFAGTTADNIKDSVQKGRHAKIKNTHCPHGHEFTEANTYLAPRSKARLCRACRRISSRWSKFK